MNAHKQTYVISILLTCVLCVYDDDGYITTVQACVLVCEIKISNICEAYTIQVQNVFMCCVCALHTIIGKIIFCS